jgi:pimeloyl-ACP methyl ester carboxylesterase
MERAQFGDITLEYEVQGSGDPVLLIGGAHVAGSYVPLVAQRELADRYRLIRYHKRGMAGSTHTVGPVSIADHADDAARLLDHVGVSRAHVVGHSSGGAIALQLTIDRTDRVETLVLLEPAMLWVPGAEALMAKTAASVEAYNAGDHEEAVACFLSAASGLDWKTCRTRLEELVPGGVAQAIADADTFFTVELPAVAGWRISANQAATIRQPVLSVFGTRTEPMFFDAAELLRRWIPHVEELTLDLGHLLHLEQPNPLAHGLADFFARHPMRIPSGVAQQSRAENNQAVVRLLEARHLPTTAH